MNWQTVFNAGLDYESFLDRHGRPEHRERWQRVYDQTVLSPAQRELLASFTRPMKVICLAGAWCGDCVNQCPILYRFSQASACIDLRFVDRDADADLRRKLSLCAGHRVPVVVFCSEDFQECGRYGDRTLSKYREMARTQLGAACPTGIGGDSSLLSAVTQEWLNEFERIQLMLRLSPRLRQAHGD